LSRLRDRAYWWGANANGLKERALRALMPTRMRFVHYSWPLLPDICPCDIHLCDFLKERGIRGQSVFHFGTGGHHLVGLRNREDCLDNDILSITASPGEHARYLSFIVREPALGARYKVLFADIYNLRPAVLPTFDVITLFHLCEFREDRSPRRELDDAGVLDLFLRRAAPNARLIFYERSAGRGAAEPLIERAVGERHLSFDERYRSLLVYRRAR
jgi:hypothetical protein